MTPKYGLSYSAEELEWMREHSGENNLMVWNPGKVELTPDLVNGMTPEAQWGWLANKSTRGSVTRARPKAVRKVDEVKELRARVRHLEQLLAEVKKAAAGI